MASQKTKFAVGLFVAGGLACVVLVVIWLGMSRFLEKGQFYVTYFDESIQGLVVDSPVKYRGPEKPTMAVIAVVARAPVPGKCKTRLAKGIRSWQKFCPRLDHGPSRPAYLE